MKTSTVYKICKECRYFGQSEWKTGPVDPDESEIYRTKDDARDMITMCYLDSSFYKLYDRLIIQAPGTDDKIDGVVFINSKETVKYYIAECTLSEPD